MARPIRYAGGVFSKMHRALVGIDIAFDTFDPSGHDPALLELAGRVWQDRVGTEFRSVQIMTRFLTELLGAGDPFDVYAGALDMIEDEIRHAAICAELTRVLGVTPRFPDPIELRDPERYLKAPMAERAIATAISMVAISETLSVGFVEDLSARCKEPVVSDVLEATLGDEAEHQAYGWTYVEQSMGRFPSTTLPDFRHLVQTTLATHRTQAERILSEVPKSKQNLEAWPEPERAALGMFSPQRQALVYQETYREVLAPRLVSLGLL